MFGHFQSAVDAIFMKTVAPICSAVMSSGVQTADTTMLPLSHDGILSVGGMTIDHAGQHAVWIDPL